MRIGVDGSALYGRFGGVEYALWNLLLALRDAEREEGIPLCEWKVWVPKDGPLALARRLFPVNWRFERLGFEGTQKARRIAWQQTILPQAARRARLDVLHCPTYVCPLRRGIPVALTIYDFIALAQPHFATRLNRLHYGFLLPRCARRASRVLVPSEAALADLRRFAPGARGVLLPLGVEEAFFRDPEAAELEAARAKWRLPQRFVLFVGNPEPKKNVAAIVRALRALPPQRRVPLIVTGGARAWKAFEERHLQSAGGGEVEVRSLGYVERGELPLLFRLCSAFAFPSLAEGFGLPVLEALACGAPVVASERVPIEGLETVARIIGPEDEGALARELERMLAEEAAPEQRARGREWASRFTWRRAALSTFDVYRDIAPSG